LSEHSGSVRSGSIPRIPAIDGLRALATLTVVGFHCYLTAGQLGVVPGAVVQYTLWTFASGAVDLFFVISGFVITSVLDSTRSAAHPIRTFYVRRAMRIIPLYYGFLLVTMPLFSHLPATTTGPPGSRVWEWLFLTNFRAGLFGWRTVGNMYRHFWTIAIEEQYYIVWPLIVLLLPPRRVLQICAALIAISVIARLTVSFAGHPETGFFLTPMRLDGLAAGSAIALLHRRNPRFVTAVGDRVFFWLAPVMLNWVVALLLFPRHTNFAIAYWVTACPLVFSLFYAALVARYATRVEESKHGWLASQPLMAVARYSYGMYAVHALVLAMAYTWVIRHGRSFSHHQFLYWAATFIAVGGLSFVIGSATWKLYEAPILRRAPRYTGR
jgi:peptidoglycan/LPS O-acetylase OafA/YrhL